MNGFLTRTAVEEPTFSNAKLVITLYLQILVTNNHVILVCCKDQESLAYKAVFCFTEFESMQVSISLFFLNGVLKELADLSKTL